MQKSDFLFSTVWPKSVASDGTAQLSDLPHRATVSTDLVPDSSNQMSNPQTIVFMNFFNISSPSFLSLLTSISSHTHNTTCMPSQAPLAALFSRSVFPSLPSQRLWGSQKEWTHVWRWGEEPETGLTYEKRERTEDGDPGCAGLTINWSINWSLWKLSWDNLTENYQEMPRTFQITSSLPSAGITCQGIWHAHSHETAEFPSLF